MSKRHLVEEAVEECLAADAWAIPSIVCPEDVVVDVFDGGKASKLWDTAKIPDELKGIDGPVAVVVDGEEAYKLWQDTIDEPIPDELKGLSRQELDAIYNRDPKKYESLYANIRKVESRLGLDGLTLKVWSYFRHAEEQGAKIIRDVKAE